MRPDHRRRVAVAAFAGIAAAVPLATIVVTRRVRRSAPSWS
jgi:hypothetical protein